jgi:hypothetical protein
MLETLSHFSVALFQLNFFIGIYTFRVRSEEVTAVHLSSKKHDPFSLPESFCFSDLDLALTFIQFSFQIDGSFWASCDCLICSQA